MEELYNDDIIVGPNTFAISRRSIYEYEIASEFKDEPSIIITVEEYIAIKEKKAPLYNVFINLHHLKVNQPREEIPERFLYIIDLIDHYVETQLRKDNRRKK